jgi:L-lactate dehydrogenase complex protein LldF
VKRAGEFKTGVAAALANEALQRALADVPAGFVAARAKARAALPEFEALRRTARDIRDHTLARLDAYLEAFERKAVAAGAVVHWAASGEEACDIVLGICRAAGARVVTKSKSMLSEEISLNAHLEAAGHDVVETDLGEYIIQLRGETPSHIIAPAIHLRAGEVADEFRRAHAHLDPERDLTAPEALVAEARGELRAKFLAAEVGITGANFLIAETGSAVVVTNEGNADLTMSLPKVHIVLASIDKVVPTLADAFVLLRLLARSATGQAFTAYTTLATGVRRAGDADGPEACHVVIVDNGRAELLAGELRAVLRCIRCGACMNHCPVYCAIGGHAYSSVYPGPIGAVLNPALAGIEVAGHLAQASTFCGRCEEVCPVEIPLVALMRRWREMAAGAPSGWRSRALLRAWARLACSPFAYRLATRIAARALHWLGGAHGRLRRLPFAARWTEHRDLPAPQGRTFQDLWARRAHRRTSA